MRPTCSNCEKSQRECVYETPPHASAAAPSVPTTDRLSKTPHFPNDRPSLERSFWSASFTDPTPAEAAAEFTSPHDLLISGTEQLAQGTELYQYVYSPEGTMMPTDFLPADLASIKWLDLLASDAMQ